MMDFWRQQDLISADALGRYPITLIGCGGIGSSTAMILAKMGVTDLTVYDPDVVEAHNLPNQNFRLRDVGEFKVKATAEILTDFTGCVIKAHATEFPLDLRPRGVVISGLDSMEARSNIWHRCIRLNMGVKRYFDARMGAEEGRIYTINPCDPEDIERYEASLYSDADAAQEPCSAKSTGYNGARVAAEVVARVKRFVMDQPVAPEYLFDFATGSSISLSNR